MTARRHRPSLRIPIIVRLGWVNATVDFLGEQGTTNKDGWLTYNDDDDADIDVLNKGVGGYQPVLRYAEAKGTSVKDAIAASPLTLANASRGIGNADAYCAVASAVDLLGNESSLPDEDDGDCLIAGVAAVVDDDGHGNESKRCERLRGVA